LSHSVEQADIRFLALMNIKHCQYVSYDQYSPESEARSRSGTPVALSSLAFGGWNGVAGIWRGIPARQLPLRLTATIGEEYRMFFSLFSKRIGPVDGSSDRAARAAAATRIRPEPPPLRPEEHTGSLARLQNDLNREMKCPAGRNQVYIRSLVTMQGTTKPRMALKCSYRRDAGESPDVFLDDIRRLCCGDPQQCAAYRAFRDRHTPT
jgi:hypothetical protein